MRERNRELTPTPSSLFRLQEELNKLVLRHAEQITDLVAKATKLSSIYEVLLQGLIASLTRRCIVCIVCRANMSILS